MEITSSFAEDLYQGRGLNQNVDLRLFTQEPTDARTGELSGSGYPSAGLRVVLANWTILNGVATLTDRQFLTASAAITGITHVGGYVGTGANSLKFFDQITSTNVPNGGVLRTGTPTLSLSGTTRIEDSFLTDLLNGTGLNQTLSIGLFDAEPTDARADELSGHGYSAGSVGLSDWTISGATATLNVQNLFTATSDVPSADRPTHMGFYRGSGAGSLKFWRNFTALEIGNGQIVETTAATRLTLDLTA